MRSFEIKDTEIEGLKLINPIVYPDERGYYIKSYEKDLFAKLGMNIGIQELCGSYSRKGVLRGLHFQFKNAQSKLVRCAYGELYDVCVDLRKNSSTFGKWHGELLTSENNLMLYIPDGFAHGVLALTEPAVLSYHSAEVYEPNFDSGIIWNDGDLKIEWPLDKVDGKTILSEKDKKLMTFDTFKKIYGGL